MTRSLFAAPQTSCPFCGHEKPVVDGWRIRNRLLLPIARLLARLASPLVEVFLCCVRCGQRWPHLHALPRTVLGYHGCRRDRARELVFGRRKVRDWTPSRNEWDWLGAGVYFWEFAPGRAWQWADEHYGDDGAVVVAEIRLGRCFDLGDTRFAALLREAHADIVRLYEERSVPLPRNAGRDGKVRKLDRLVLDRLMEALDHAQAASGVLGSCFQTVRCPFEEGTPVYEQSMIRSQSHIQIAVRDRDCISPRVFLQTERGT